MKWNPFISMILMVSFAGNCQQLISISYFDGNQKLNGLVTSNHGKKLPGVLILPAWKGIDNEAKTAAIELEKKGYIAFIADIYGEGNIPVDNASAAKIAGYYKQDYQAYQKRINLALEQLVQHGATLDKIAVIGYCFGGTGALEAARGGLPVKGVVSIHGGLSKGADRTVQPIATRVLVEHPAEDKSVSKVDFDNFIVEMNSARADWQIITYSGCGHTFTNPESKDYNALMAERAWNHTLLFLKELLE